MVEALIGGYPDAVKSREEKWGRLPIHIACIHSASAQVLRLLTETYEESLRITDKVYGRLPLHFACLYGSPFEISLLVSAEQRALVFKDANGKTPKDLAEESCNPHREAIVQRLEDRTRVVTEAMIMRRKQQSESPQDQLKRKVSSRKSSRSSFIIPSEDIQAIHHANRRAKSLVLGQMGDDVTVRKANTTRTKSTGIGDATRVGKNGRSSHVAKSGGLAKLEQEERGSRTMDDSNIGKVSKLSRRNRTENKPSSSRQRIERRTSDPFQSRRVDPDKALKPRSGRTGIPSLLKQLEETKGSDEEKYDLEKTKKPSKPMARLSMFLQSHEVDSSEDERESDGKSLGAQSLPVLLHSRWSSKMTPQRATNQQIVKTFMFQDSDDGMEVAKGTASSADSDDSFEGNSQVVVINERLRHLDIRREALSRECEAIHATIAKKEDAAQRSRKVVGDIRRQLLELKEKLEKEENAVSLAETGIQLQKETLAVHEIKIRAVDSEKAMVFAQKAELEDNVEASDDVATVVAP